MEVILHNYGILQHTKRGRSTGAVCSGKLCTMVGSSIILSRALSDFSKNFSMRAMSKISMCSLPALSHKNKALVCRVSAIFVSPRRYSSLSLQKLEREVGYITKKNIKQVHTGVGVAQNRAINYSSSCARCIHNKRQLFFVFSQEKRKGNKKMKKKGYFVMSISFVPI